VRLRDKYYEHDLYLDLESGYGSDEKIVTVHALYLPPEERGKGVGTKVMTGLIEECRKAGFYAIQLEAFPKVEDEEGVTGEEIKGLIHWYESLGFELDDPSSSRRSRMRRNTYTATSAMRGGVLLPSGWLSISLRIGG